MPIIDHLNLANTWNDWLTGTQQLISFANNFTENANMVSVHSGVSPFLINNDLKIDGDLDVTGNFKLNIPTDYDNLTLGGNLILSQSDTGESGVYYEVANTAPTAATRWSIMGDSSVYSFDFSNEGNPDLYLESGQTYAFDLQKLNGAHPFVIRTTNENSNVSDGGSYYNVGLTHIDIEGGGGSIKTSRGYDAQGKNNGILYWKVPANTIGGIYYYQCTAHPAMNGTIYIENSNAVALEVANGIGGDAVAFAIGLG